MMDILAELNPPQREAVETISGPVLILVVALALVTHVLEDYLLGWF